MDDILERFAALSAEPDEVRYVRGPVLALAMDWLARLTPCPAKDEAIDFLELAADAADRATKV